MKKISLIYYIFLFIAIFCSSNKAYSQATSANGTNSPVGSNEYLGWTSGTNLALDIKNEDARSLKFYTNAGSGTYNNLRVIIYDAAGSPSTAGFVGIGIATPNYLLHQDGGTGNATYHQFTNNATSGTGSG